MHIQQKPSNPTSGIHSKPPTLPGPDKGTLKVLVTALDAFSHYVAIKKGTIVQRRKEGHACEYCQQLGRCLGLAQAYKLCLAYICISLWQCLIAYATMSIVDIVYRLTAHLAVAFAGGPNTSHSRGTPLLAHTCQFTQAPACSL